MRFKDWLKERSIEIESYEVLADCKVDYIGTYLDVLERVYNLYDITDFMHMEGIKIFHVNGKSKFPYYFAIDHDCVFDFDSIFDLVRNFTRYMLVDQIDRENFENMLVRPPYDINMDNKFYFHASLNPSDYVSDYITKIEPVINKDLVRYGTVDELYNSFITLLETDKVFRASYQILSGSFGILMFNSKEDLNSYIEGRNKIPDPQVIKIGSLEDLGDLGKIISEKLNNIDDDDEVEDLYDLSSIDAKLS